MTADRRLLFELLTGRVRGAVADQALDVQLLQTAASVENALFSAYEALLGLPVLTSTGYNPVLRGLLFSARDQHADHARACNDIAGKLGGKSQTGINSALAQVVSRARSGSNDLGAAIDVALQLEMASAQTHQNAVGLLADLNARRLAGSIMGVESQHIGMLLVARALVAARTPELISQESGTTAKLPPDAAKAGFPDAFSKTDQARPAGEGAIR